MAHINVMGFRNKTSTNRKIVLLELFSKASADSEKSSRIGCNEKNSTHYWLSLFHVHCLLYLNIDYGSSKGSKAATLFVLFQLRLAFQPGHQLTASHQYLLAFYMNVVVSVKL